jgi:spermidine/putrescine transport system ATP-binding protein
LGGFIDPDEGEVLIEGKVVNGVPPSDRDTNMVFQQLALFPHMSVFDNIGFGLKMKKVDREEIKSRVLEMLRLVRLEDYDKRRISQLSGGQQQRIAIARALINRPQVLLLDEPLGALDLQLRFNMQEELKRVQDQVGTTFVYVTHDQGEALAMSDRIAVMNEGRLVQIGSPTEIYEKPRTAFVAKFIGNTNLIKITVEGSENSEVVVRAGPLLMRGKAIEPIISKEAWISIRPEKVVLGSRASELSNHFQGRVLKTVFKGTVYEYQIALDDDIIFDAVVSNDDSEERFDVDSTIDVGWHVTSAQILPE